MDRNPARRNEELRAALMGQDTEKNISLYEVPRSGRKMSLGTIVGFQHVLLWCSAFLLASETYMLVIDAITPEILPSPIVLIFAATMSIIYLFFHNIAALLTSKGSRGRRDEPGAVMRWLAVIVLRFDVTIWLAACCINVTFTIAKQPYCFFSKTAANMKPIDEGNTCIIQRTGVGASLLALLASFVLFVLIHKTLSPFRAHLFGIAAAPDLLLHQAPYKASATKAMYSEMSFQCRSSSSLARHTLTRPPPPFDRSNSDLLPACPETPALGLGIHTPPKRGTDASLLTPKPSLASLRPGAAISSQPRSSPLPPLPVYLYARHYKPGSSQRLTPRYQLGRSSSGRTMRLAFPSPAALKMNLPSDLDRSESMSSIYSRRISGESLQPTRLGDTGRTYSTSTVCTSVKSPLSTVQRGPAWVKVAPVEHKKRKLDKKWSFECDSDDSDIDDAATLQARLPAVTVARTDGYTSLARKATDPGYQQAGEGAGLVKPSPLHVRKADRLAV